MQGRFVCTMRHHTQRVDKLTEGRALPEESEGNLRVWQLPQGFEKLACLVDSFLRVRVAKIRRPYGTTQQLEVALVAKDNILWEQRLVQRRIGTSGRNHLAFGGIELKANVARRLLEPVKSFGDGLLVAGQTKVIQVRKNELKACPGAAGL
jgi:hypothetical protein